MITATLISDADLQDAYAAGRQRNMSHYEGCRAVAELAIATYINATIPGKLEQLDRVTAAVERLSGEVLA